MITLRQWLETTSRHENEMDTRQVRALGILSGGPVHKRDAVNHLGGDEPGKVWASLIRSKLVAMKDNQLYLTPEGKKVLVEKRPVKTTLPFEEGTVDHPWGRRRLPEYMKDTIGTQPACLICGSTAGVKRYNGHCAPCEDKKTR